MVLVLHLFPFQRVLGFREYFLTAFVINHGRCNRATFSSLLYSMIHKKNRIILVIPLVY